MSNELNHVLIAGIINGFNDQNRDQTQTGAQALVTAVDGLQVSKDHMPNLQRLTGDQHTFAPHADPSLPVVFRRAYPGATHGTIQGYLTDAPKPSTPPAGTSSWFEQRFGPAGAIDPYNLPLNNGTGFSPPQKSSRDGVLNAVPNDNIDYTVLKQVINQQRHYGAPADERNPKWEQKSGINTAESPFGSLPSFGMLAGLPGMIMSLVSTFSSLSQQQKQQIQANTSPSTFALIEATMSVATDVGDTSSVSLSSRVHPDVFANNMVQVLSRVKTAEDISIAMHELRTNTALHGKDQLPTVEYRIANQFGETGLIIDGSGEFTQNISAEYAQAEAAFTQFITQGVDNVEILGTFEGQISANTLTVNRIDFGHLQKGPTIFIEGQGVTDNTRIASFGAGANGNTGTYILTLASQTLPNTPMIIYRTTSVPVANSNTAPVVAGGGGGGSGLGGMVGMLGTNMFGEASKLMGEIMPVLHPSGAARVQATLGSINQGQILKAASHALQMKKGFAGLPVKLGSLGQFIPPNIMSKIGTLKSFLG